MDTPLLAIYHLPRVDISIYFSNFGAGGGC